MPSSISPLAQALRLLKVELTQARTLRSGTKTADATGSAEPSKLSATVAATALQGLPAKLRMVRAQANGNLPRAKALRLFVEAALLDELGSELQLDPAFNSLVERACRAIEQDSGSAPLLDEALRDLQALSQ